MTKTEDLQMNWAEKPDWIEAVIYSQADKELQLYCEENVFTYHYDDPQDPNIQILLDDTLGFGCEHEWLEAEMEHGAQVNMKYDPNV